MQGYSLAFDTLPKSGRQCLQLQQLHADADAMGDRVFDPRCVWPAHAARDEIDVAALAEASTGEAANEPSAAALRKQRWHQHFDLAPCLGSPLLALGASLLRAFANQPCSCPASTAMIEASHGWRTSASPTPLPLPHSDD